MTKLQFRCISWHVYPGYHGFRHKNINNTPQLNQWYEDLKYEQIFSCARGQNKYFGSARVNNFETHLRTIQSNWITSAISYPTVPSPVHTQRGPVTCNTDVFQGTFVARNDFIALYLVRHDGFVWTLTRNRWNIAVGPFPRCPTSSAGVRPPSKNTYPIYDQNLWFSPPYLGPDQKFDTLFMTWLLVH